MNIITKKTVIYYTEQYPLAKTALLYWLKDFGTRRFDTFNKLKEVFGNASIIANHRVIFNIKGNDFRLITTINFRAQAVYIIWFGTHNEYDRIDAETIKYIDVR